MNEVPVAWTCPNCQKVNNDSVHWMWGPWLSCTCGFCGLAFSDEELTEADAAAWDEARDKAYNLHEAEAKG